MGLVTLPECDVCGSRNNVVKLTLVVFEHTYQLILDYVPPKTADELLDKGDVKYLCPRHLKRARRFLERAFTAPTARKPREPAVVADAPSA